jgi:hypothetical protein
MDASSIMMVMQTWNEEFRSGLSPAAVLSLIDDTTDMALLLDGVQKHVKDTAIQLEFYRYAAVKCPAVLRQFTKTLPRSQSVAHQFINQMLEGFPKVLAGTFGEVAINYWKDNWEEDIKKVCAQFTLPIVNLAHYANCLTDGSSVREFIRKVYPNYISREKFFPEVREKPTPYKNAKTEEAPCPEKVFVSKDRFLDELYAFKTDVLITGKATNLGLVEKSTCIPAEYVIDLLNAEGKSRSKATNTMLRRVKHYELTYKLYLGRTREATLAGDYNAPFNTVRVGKAIDMEWKRFTKKSIIPTGTLYINEEVIPLLHKDFPHEAIVEDKIQPKHVIDCYSTLEALLSLLPKQEVSSSTLSPEGTK